MQPQQRMLTVSPDDRNQTATDETPVQRFVAKPGVLVVDDEHLVRIMVQLSLERNGFDVLLASNGREAIELFQKHRETIAVVLLDVRMPGLDGVETLEILRDLECEVPACLMTGDPGAYEPDELQQCGVAHLIAKPFQLGELVSILTLLTSRACAEVLPSGSVCQA